MRKLGWIILIVVLIVAGVYGRKAYKAHQINSDQPSLIDTIISESTGKTTEDTGVSTINIQSDSNGGLMYPGGGTYDNFSDALIQGAHINKQRIVLIFEEQGDPTSEALHEDIITHKARIPQNTLFVFATLSTDTAIAQKLHVTHANTIVYIGDNGQEIRRSGNGIITLAQVVSGIDGLVTK